jgi:hypothetical protein
MRIGPRQRELHDIASAMPGCSKRAALRAAGLPVAGMGHARPLDRAIRAGLVLVEYERANLCRLFATETDRELWHLRAELMAGPDAERAGQIAAEVRRLRQAQAASWT